MYSELCTGMAELVASVAAAAVAGSGWFRKGPSEANALASRDEQGEMAGSDSDCASVLAAIVANPFFSARLRRLHWHYVAYGTHMDALILCSARIHCL